MKPSKWLSPRDRVLTPRSSNSVEVFQEAELQENPADTYSFVADIREELQKSCPDTPMKPGSINSLMEHPDELLEHPDGPLAYPCPMESLVRKGPTSLGPLPLPPTSGSLGAGWIPRNSGDGPPLGCTPYRNMPTRLLSHQGPGRCRTPPEPAAPITAEEAVYLVERRIGSLLQEWMLSLEKLLKREGGCSMSSMGSSGGSADRHGSQMSSVTSTRHSNQMSSATSTMKNTRSHPQQAAARAAQLERRRDQEEMRRKKAEGDSRIVGELDASPSLAHTISEDIQTRESMNSQPSDMVRLSTTPSLRLTISQDCRERSQQLRKSRITMLNHREIAASKSGERLTVLQMMERQTSLQPSHIAEASESEEQDVWPTTTISSRGRENACNYGDSRENRPPTPILMMMRTQPLSLETDDCVGSLVVHPAFDFFFAGLIILNSMFIGLQTEYQSSFGFEKEEPLLFSITEKLFVFAFVSELILRLMALRCNFFTSVGRSWNLFDLFLVTLSLVELGLEVNTGERGASGASGSIGKVIRMFRMARIIRIMRVLRFLAELRVLVTLIVHSMRALFWLMILLVIILYVFAICFTQAGADFRSSDLGKLHYIRTAAQIDKSYGSLGMSVYTLFMSITGGVSWGEVLEPLAYTGPVFTALFLCYIFFAVFSVLNIVTGVFVDGAIQRSGQERDLRLEKERDAKETYVSMLMDLIEEIDSEGTGNISRQDLEAAFKDQRIRHYFSILEIDISESNYLFDMLDVDRNGEVDWNEFVEGCSRLKGSAKSLDVHTLMYEIKLMMSKFDRFMLDMSMLNEGADETGSHVMGLRSSSLNGGSHRLSWRQ